MKKQQLYPLIRSLQSRAIVESSLDRPAIYTAVAFEKVLDLFAKTKIEEAKIIQQSKEEILFDWKSINLPEVKSASSFFNVIQGKKIIYSKIQQMIQETNSQFSVIMDLSSIIRSEQAGVLDSIQSHLKKSVIEFRILTDIPNNYFQVVKNLSESLDPHIVLKGLNTSIGSSLIPRMVIRDNDEILYFVSDKTGEMNEQRYYSCLLTNCPSVVKPFSNVFEELWQNSTDSKQKIREIETGVPPQKTLIIKDAAEAQAKYDEVFKKAKKEILIVTSADSLYDFGEMIPKIKELTQQNISIKIMSSITRENLKFANTLQIHSQVRHIPEGYLDTIIVDNNHLFQFANPKSMTNGFETKQKLKNAFYTNNQDYVTKAKNMLENVWTNSSDISNMSIESIFNPLEPYSTALRKFSNDPSSEVIFNYLKSQPVISRTSPGEVTEKEVVAKIIELRKSEGYNGKVVKCYCRIGYAAINPPSQFDLPKMLIVSIQIDKKSSFGAEDRLVFHVWEKTEEGFNYVPLAIIGDNPNFPVEMLEIGQYRNTPAAKNFRLVRKEEIQFQLYGNTFLASWTIPVRLSDNITLPPGTIILEAYGDVKPKRVMLRYPTGTTNKIFYNALDSFVTYMHKSSKYVGPGTDGLFLRDAFIEIFPSSQRP